MPKVDDSIAVLGDSRIFSQLDANSGFWQINLSETSRELTTFITPFGRFCFNRLPFGISSAPEIFSRMMSKLLSGIEGVICYIDDILIHGKDRESHDKVLRQVLRRLDEAGLTLNKDKCRFWKTKVKFLGHIIVSEGIKPDPAKVETIKKFPTPTNRTELRRVMGSLNQLAKFIPALATTNARLRELLKERNECRWGPAQDKALKEIKDQLVSLQVMAHYSPDLETLFSTGASQLGIGAVIYQVQRDGTRRPVCYCSQTPRETEKNYAVIKKEALGMAWACDKLDQYVRGMKFAIETDHKPLVRLMNTKDLDQIPARILRMKLRLMRYAPEVRYVPGIENNLADALSRISVGSPTKQDVCFVEEVESVNCSTFPTDPLINEISEAQLRDSICLEIRNCVNDGWGTYKTDAKTAIHPYWDVRAHITESNGLLLYDRRIIVPTELRVRILDKIHQAHQGITKCLARARRSVWWPGMSRQIKEMVQSCRLCTIQSRLPVEPLNPSTLPSRAWSRVGADLFEFQKLHFLLVVDYYS